MQENPADDATCIYSCDHIFSSQLKSKKMFHPTLWGIYKRKKGNIEIHKVSSTISVSTKESVMRWVEITPWDPCLDQISLAISQLRVLFKPVSAGQTM